MDEKRKTMTERGAGKIHGMWGTTSLRSTGTGCDNRTDDTSRDYHTMLTTSDVGEVEVEDQRCCMLLTVWNKNSPKRGN